MLKRLIRLKYRAMVQLERKMPEASFEQLRWQCRRGMLELDELLSKFFEAHYCNLSFEKREMFKNLLSCSDQELYGWFLQGKQPSDSGIAEIVSLIRASK